MDGQPSKDRNYVNVPVPEHLVGDVMRFIVDNTPAFNASGAPVGGSEAETRGADSSPDDVGNSPLTDDEPKRAPHDHAARESWAAWAQMPDELVELAYTESAVDGAHRELFEFLADHPDERMTYEDICGELGWGRRKLPAILGTYGRRSASRYDGGYRPFHIYQDQRGTWWMWMDAHRADIIRRLAGPARAAREQVQEVIDLGRFRELVVAGEGFLVITDTAGEDAKAHDLTCDAVNEANFTQKVLSDRRNGAYYWVPTLEVADVALGARPCRQCRPPFDR
jgi:hypothetical protein